MEVETAIGGNPLSSNSLLSSTTKDTPRTMKETSPIHSASTFSPSHSTSKKSTARNSTSAPSMRQEMNGGSGGNRKNNDTDDIDVGITESGFKSLNLLHLTNNSSNELSSMTSNGDSVDCVSRTTETCVSPPLTSNAKNIHNANSSSMRGQVNNGIVGDTVRGPSGEHLSLPVTLNNSQNKRSTAAPSSSSSSPGAIMTAGSVTIVNKKRISSSRTPTRKARRVKFYRNGDRFYPGITIPVSNERYR